MSPPIMAERPDAAGSGFDPSETDRLGDGAIKNPSNSDGRTTQLDALTDDLELIAQWREDLLSRIRRRQFTVEILDCRGDDADLIAEADLFGRACRAVAWLHGLKWQTPEAAA